MANTKEAPVKSKKKVLRAQIAKTLQKTFSSLKKTMGEKKFNRHIKKASKVLVSGAVKKTKKDKAELSA